MAEKKQAPLNKLLTIYFYHTRLTRESYEEWKEYKFPDTSYTDFLYWRITEYAP